MPTSLQSLNVSIPIVGKSTLKSCFVLGSFIKIPFFILDLVTDYIITFVPFLVSLEMILLSLIITACV